MWKERGNGKILAFSMNQGSLHYLHHCIILHTILGTLLVQAVCRTRVTYEASYVVTHCGSFVQHRSAESQARFLAGDLDISFDLCSRIFIKMPYVIGPGEPNFRTWCECYQNVILFSFISCCCSFPNGNEPMLF